MHGPDNSTGDGVSNAPNGAEHNLDAVDGEGCQPKNPVVTALLHVKWAELLQKANKHERAAHHFAAAIALKPSATAHFGLGTSLTSLRRRAEAEVEFRESLRIRPNMVCAHVNLASVLIALGRYEESTEHCRLALEVEPGCREAVMNLANALRNLDRRAEAVHIVWHHIVEMADGSVVGDVSLCQSPLCCKAWNPRIRSDSCADFVVVCVKWGSRYGVEYVNRLYSGVRRHLAHQSVPFICFTDNPDGIDSGVIVRELPEKFPLWWGKAYLFSAAAGLDGKRVLFMDLDQVIVGDLAQFWAYSGPFAVLSTDGIACELARGGYNSSVMAWEASPFFRPIFDRLGRAARQYVHRFDHWLEMNVDDADVWQSLAPGRVVDYTTAFLGGVCLGEPAQDIVADQEGTFRVPENSANTEVSRVDALKTAGETTCISRSKGEFGQTTANEGSRAIAPSIVTFPRSPKPHEIEASQPWLYRNWICAESS